MLRKYYPSSVWKHCPYCGTNQIEWKENTKCMHCTQCKGNFFINASAAVVALIKNNKGELLFTRRKNDPAKGLLDLPGGFVNLMETSEDAVKREIKEELNLNITQLDYQASYPNQYLYNNIVYFTVDSVFNCNVDGFDNIKADDDVSEYIFIHPKDIDLEEIGLDSIRTIASRLVEQQYKIKSNTFQY